MTEKISIRFFNDRQVRAVWDGQDNKRWFNVVDVVSALNNESDYTKAGNYWRWLKRKMIKEKNESVSATYRVKFTAVDGKKYFTDALDSDGTIKLAKEFPNNRAMKFLDWFVYSDNTIDGQSKKKAYALLESNLINEVEVGTAKDLQQIHGYIFGGLYDFAGQVRKLNISKGGFLFANANFLQGTLRLIERMPEKTLDEILDKYIEMNIAHPFMEGNGRSIRIWLDLMLKKNLKLCVDWSAIGKKDYLAAMVESSTDATKIKTLIGAALDRKIDDREIFMKGIDYSYYYEEDN